MPDRGDDKKDKRTKSTDFEVADPSKMTEEEWSAALDEWDQTLAGLQKPGAGGGTEQDSAKAEESEAGPVSSPTPPEAEDGSPVSDMPSESGGGDEPISHLFDGESDDLELPDVDEALDDILRDSQSLSPILDGQGDGGGAQSARSEEATRIASIEDILAQAGPLAEEDEAEVAPEPFSDEATRIAGPELGAILAASAEEAAPAEDEAEPDDFYDDIEVEAADEEEEESAASKEEPSAAVAAAADSDVVWSAEEAVADEIGALEGVASSDLDHAVDELAAMSPGTFGGEPRPEEPLAVQESTEAEDAAGRLVEEPVGAFDESTPVPSGVGEVSGGGEAESATGLALDSDQGPIEREEEEPGAQASEVAEAAEQEEVAGRREPKTAEPLVEGGADGAVRETAQPEEASEEVSEKDSEGARPAPEVGLPESESSSVVEEPASRTMGEVPLDEMLGSRESEDAGLGILDDLAAGAEPAGAEDVLSELAGPETMDPMLAEVLDVGFVFGEVAQDRRLDGAEDLSFEPEPVGAGLEREAREFQVQILEGLSIGEPVGQDWFQKLAGLLEQDAAACDDEHAVASREMAAGLVFDVGLEETEQALGRYMDSISRGANGVECLWCAAGAAFRLGEWSAFTTVHERAAEVLTGADAVAMSGVMAEVSFHLGDESRGKEILGGLAADRSGRIWNLLAEHDLAVAAGLVDEAAAGLVRLGAETPSERDGGELMLMGGDIFRAASAFTKAMEAYDKALQAEGGELLRGLAHRGKMWCCAAEGNWADAAEELGRLAGMVQEDVAGGIRRREVEIYWRRLHDADKALAVLAGMDEKARNSLVDIEAEALAAQDRHDEAAEAFRRAATEALEAEERARLLFLGGRVAESSVGAQSLSEELYREALAEMPGAAGAELGLWRRLLASEADRSPGRELLRWVADVQGMRKDMVLSWLAREHRLAGEEEAARKVLEEARSSGRGLDLYPLLEAALEGDSASFDGLALDSAGDVAASMVSWLAVFVDPTPERFEDLAGREPWLALWPLRVACLQEPDAPSSGWGAFWAVGKRIGREVDDWFVLRRMGTKSTEDRSVLRSWPGAFLKAARGGSGETDDSPWTVILESEEDEVSRAFAAWLDAVWAELFTQDHDRVVAGYEQANSLGIRPLRGLTRVLLAEGRVDRLESLVTGEGAAENALVRYALFSLLGRLEEAAEVAKTLSDNDPTGVWSAEWESLQQEMGAWPTLASEAIARLQKTDEAGDQEAKIRAYEQLVWVDRDGRGEESSAMLGYSSLLQLDPSNQRARRALELYYAADGRLDDLVSVYDVGSQSEDLPPVEQSAILVRLFTLLRRLGRQDRAVDAARRLVGLDPTRIGAQLYLESWARTKGDLDLLASTWGALAAVLDGHPVSRAAALSRAGEARLEQQRVEEARAFLAAAVEGEAPSVVPCAAWLRLGMTQEQWEDVASAAETLAGATSLPETKADAFLLAGVVSEEYLSDDERAESFYRACLAVRSDDFDAYARLADLLRRNEDYERLAEVIEERLAVETSASVKVDLLWELARLWRDKLGSSARAIEFFDALLALKPDHQSALNAVADLYEAEGRYDEVTDILARICRLEKDPEVLQGLLYRLGTIFEEQLGDERKAAAVFNQAVTVNPNHIEALERLAAIHEHLGEWKAALSVSGRILKIVTDPKRQVGEYVRLARILEHGYKDMRRAQEALRRAVATAPEDLTAIGEMASFYARRGDMSSLLVHLDQAASVMRERLERDALDVEPYRALVQIFKWRRSGGRAARAAEILDLFGLAGPDDLALLTEHPIRAVEPRALVGPEVDDVLFGRAMPSSLRQIFRILGQGLAKHYAGSLKEYGLARSTRISTNDALGAMASDLAAALGVKHYEIHRSTSRPRVVAMEPGDPPVLILGEELLSSLDEAALEFVLLRFLKLVQTGLVVPAKIPSEETAVLVAAVIRQYVTDYDVVGLDPKVLVERTKLVGKLIPRRSRDEITPYAYECSSTNLDFAEVRRAVVRGADRAALLGTGRIQPAVQALASAQSIRLDGPAEARIGALRGVDEIQALLRFAVSEDAFSLAAQLGVGGL